MADILLTKLLTDLGAVELNPIIDYLLSVNFFAAFAFKVLITAAFIAVAVRLRDRVAHIGSIVTGANIFLAVIVVYQLIGVVVLSY